MFRKNTAMKKDIHPAYFPQAKITCACGNIMTIGSTKEHIEVEICSACHPFYTGKEKLLDAAGRVERFERRRKVAAERQGKTVKTKSALSPTPKKRAPGAKSRKVA